MVNSTLLDHRSFCGAVERFDPGPWTTHFNQFPPREPEDTMTQIEGMARVIRNEDSYKRDSELHELLDDAMIMMWAFKTVPGFGVLKE